MSGSEHFEKEELYQLLKKAKSVLEQIGDVDYESMGIYEDSDYDDLMTFFFEKM